MTVFCGETKNRHAGKAWRPLVESASSRAGSRSRLAYSLWAHKWYAIAWVRGIDPSRLAVRKNVDDHKHGRDTTRVTRQVYVSAAYVGESLACVVDCGCAGGVVALVQRELSRYHRDQAGARMRMPPSVTPGHKCVLRDKDVRVASDPRDELPKPRVVTHQIERAIWKLAH